MVKRRSRLLDPRIWPGVAITIFFLWVALRDVDFAEVGRIIADANWVLLLFGSIPCYVFVLYVRALRWRHLTDPVGPIESGVLFRSVSIGFMVNNILPLRAGEFVRVWYLSRETGYSATALFSTLILERVIDAMCVIVLAIVVIVLWGASSDSVLAQGALLLLPVALVPGFLLLWLRKSPDRVIAFATWALRPFPDRWTERVTGLLRQFHAGLGSLRSGTHLLWIAVHSMLIWPVASTIPFLVGFWALGIDLGSFSDTLVVAWATLVAVALAVALPAAPGFFGLYHAAAKFALLRFGVEAKTAVALGTTVHAIMWVTVTLVGLLVLRVHHTSLRELEAAASAQDESRSE